MTYSLVLGICFIAAGFIAGVIPYFTDLQLPSWIRTKSGPDTHTRYAVRYEDRAGNTFWQPRTEDARYCVNPYQGTRLWVSNEIYRYRNDEPTLYSSHRRAERIARRRESRIAYNNTLIIDEVPGAEG